MYSGVRSPASELHFQIRPRNDPDRHTVAAAILRVDHDIAVLDARRADP